MTENRKLLLIVGEMEAAAASTARRFLRKGWQVALMDDDQQRLDTLAATCKGAKPLMQQVNLASAMEARKTMDQLVDSSGGYLHVLFINASMVKPAPFEKMSPGEHHRLLDSNLKMAINTAHGAFRYLRATPDAHMITLSSISSLYGVPEFASYAAARSGVRALTESLAIEWQRHGIHVSDVMPPVVHPGDYSGVTGKLTNTAGRLGMRVRPQLVAREVWRRAHDKNQPSDPVSALFQSGQIVNRVLPRSLQRFLIRRVTGY